MTRSRTGHSDRFSDAQLRTTQRPVLERRGGVMAERLVHAVAEETCTQLDGPLQSALIVGDGELEHLSNILR